MHAQETGGVPVLLSAKSLTALGAVINFEKGQAIFRNLELETVVQLYRSPAGHLWMDLFEQMPVVSENLFSLLGQVKTRANVESTSKNSKAQVLTAHADSQRTIHARQMHATDTPDTKTMRRPRVQFEKSVSPKPQFDLKTSATATSKDGFRESCPYVERRSDGTIRTTGMGTSGERDVHSSRK